MATETLVLTSNEAFKDVLSKKQYLFEPSNVNDLIKKVSHFMNLPRDQRKEYGKELRQEVKDNHNLDKLVDKIINQFTLFTTGFFPDIHIGKIHLSFF